MTRQAAIGHFLALLAVVGLILTPLVGPAVAKRMADTEMTRAGSTDAGMADAAMADVMDAMPCCPRNTPVPDCGHDCPLMALCSATPFGVPLAGLVAPPAEARVVLPGNQSDLVSLARAPPRRPPKHPGSSAV